ncbi:unnamed protein product [Boreogadus saida]
MSPSTSFIAISFSLGAPMPLALSAVFPCGSSSIFVSRPLLVSFFLSPSLHASCSLRLPLFVTLSPSHSLSVSQTASLSLTLCVSLSLRLQVSLSHTASLHYFIC